MIKIWRLNPMYIIARIKNYLYFKRNQDLPWMVKSANDFLIKNLRKDMIVLEFGSGRSTQFVSKRVNKVFSREHNEEWFNIVKEQIKDISNINYSFYNDLSKYADTSDIKDNSLDLVIVDGRNRVNCLLNSVSKLKSGGALVLDNAERYLIYKTNSPAQYIRNERNQKWVEAEKILKENFWRYDTTDGVADTLIFFKR